MPPIGDAHTQASRDTPQKADPAAALSASFRFIPRELATKCRRLIESYHAIYGYVGLPDMLWLSDARDIIKHDEQTDADLQARRAIARGEASQRSVSAYRNHDCVARGLGARLLRSGKRFPAAKGEAEKILGPLPQLRRTWLMDLYFFPPVGVRREFGDTLAFYPTETPT